MRTFAVLLLFAAAPVLAQETKTPTPRVAPDVSLRLEVKHVIGNGLDWLRSQQSPEGFWSEREHPAITALALAALLGDPERSPSDPLPDGYRRGLEYLRSCAKPDGGIYVKDLATYNTAISLTTLLLAAQPEDDALILAARRFLVGQQQDYDVPGEADNAFDGGIGYGGSYTHSDLSNTHLALEALALSRSLVDDKPEEKQVDLNWKAAIAFVERCQNLPTHNKEAWASDDEKNRGGFVYFPGDSKAGEETLSGGKTALRSYGSMSYAGLLSYIYAELEKDDPRVKAVVEWLSQNYSIEENPGLEAQGLYYYYNTLAKALTAADLDTLDTPGKENLDWRRELCLKLFDLQKQDGSWVNDTKRWREGDSALVTSYALLALERVYRGL
jgi:squalene-hopene/tetraprenyl-beta-curcumene cyclase